MTTEHTHSCGDHETLIAYVYDELPGAARAALTVHLGTCAACRNEVDGLRSVRDTLTAWAPPEPAWSRREVAPAAPVAPGWRAVPAWAQLVAATLLVATAVSIANVRIHSDAQGVTITTGWMAAADLSPTSVARTAAGPAGSAGPVAPAVADTPAASMPEPWRVALAETEARLRAELRARPAPVGTSAATPAADGHALRRFEALIAESEQRQQQELALRLAQLGRDVDMQRRSDLVRLEQGVGQMQGRTGAEVARQRELLNYIVRTGLRPPQP